ncbi:MAG: peptidase M14 [Acidobacteria bacterium]|nr:peptidase M14 [Acidobacteriota bacterium]
MTSTDRQAGWKGRPGRFRLVFVAVVLAGLTISVSPAGGQQVVGPVIPTPEALARLWDAEHVSPPLPPLLRHAEIDTRLRALREQTPDLFSLEEIGRSVEGRSLNHLWFGSGPYQVLLWSQMHGDEPSATAALLDVFEYIRRHRDEAVVRRLLGALTVHAVPMLNPDGAERFQRRNAQGIDINRDALLLQTPEGRTLKALRDRLQPRIGFNLHNQGWRTSAGRTGRPATISLLAVAYDEARSDNEGRIVAKQTCSVIRYALEPLAPGQIARYDDEFEVRAFGDNLTKWGTSVVLIETGAFPADPPDPALVRLNFVGLLTALDALATGRVHAADPARYESLPMNESNVFYLLIRNATIITGTGVAPFTGDVGLVANRSVLQGEGRRDIRQTLRIDDLGDLRVFGALEVIDAGGLTVAPLADPLLKAGDQARLPDWSVRVTGPKIVPGEIADLMLLEPTRDPDVYTVRRIIRAAMTPPPATAGPDGRDR